MAGPNLQYHTPMNSVMTDVTSTPLTVALPEKAGQVFPMGVPVQVNAGYVQKWDGATVLAGLAGIALIPASNLATNGAGSPGAYGQVTGTGSTSTYGNVPNMPLAVNIATGAPFTDGRTLFESSNRNTVFEGQFDNSAGNVAADYTPTLAMIGQQFGISFDAMGTSYVDASKTTTGTNTCVIVVSINPIDMVAAGTANVFIANARVRFKFLPTAVQLY
jgi:hypothetical protein